MNWTIINRDTLVKLRANGDLVEWWERNVIELPIENLKDVIGDYGDYVKWIRDHFPTEVDGRRCTVKRLDGDVTTTYDENWNPTSLVVNGELEWTRRYDAKGNCIGYSRADGYWWNKTYNEDGKLLTTEFHDGTVDEKKYDKDGRVILETKINEGVISTVYNDEYRIERHEDTFGDVVVKTYNKRGMILTHESSISGDYAFKYDELDRNVEVMVNGEVAYRTVYSEDGREEQYHRRNDEVDIKRYDELGNLIFENCHDICDTYSYDKTDKRLVLKCNDKEILTIPLLRKD